MSARARAQPWFRDSPRPLPAMTETERQWRLEQLGQPHGDLGDLGPFVVLNRDELRKLNERLAVEWAGYSVRIER